MPTPIYVIDLSAEAVREWAGVGKDVRQLCDKNQPSACLMQDGSAFWIKKFTVKRGDGRMYVTTSDAPGTGGETYLNGADMLKQNISKIFLNLEGGSCTDPKTKDVLVSVSDARVSDSGTATVTVKIGSSPEGKAMPLESLLKLEYFNSKCLRPAIATEEAEAVEGGAIACPTDSAAYELLLAVGVAEEGVDEVPFTETVEFMSGLGIKVSKFINASAALEALNAHLVSTEGKAQLADVRQLLAAGLVDIVGKPKVVGAALKGILKVVPKSAASKGKKPDDGSAQKRDRKSSKSPTKNKEESDSNDSELSESYSSDSDAAGAETTPKANKSKKSPDTSAPSKKKQKGFVQLVVAAGQDECDALYKLFSSNMAEPLREWTGAKLEDEVPSSADDKEDAVFYLSEKVSKIEKVTGLDLYDDIDFSDEKGVVRARIAMINRLEERKRRPCDFGIPDKASKSPRFDFDPGESKQKPNKDLSDAHVAEAIPSDVNKHIIDACKSETFLDDIRRIKEGTSNVSALKGDDLANVMRLSVSNGKVDAGGTLDPTLACVPHEVAKMIKAVKARAIDNVRVTVSDGLAESLPYDTASSIMTKAMCGNICFKDAISALSELKKESRTKPAVGSHMEVNGALDMLRDVLVTVFDGGLALDKFGLDFGRFYKNATQTSQASGLDAATRMTYISKVLSEWTGVIRRFRAADDDVMPRFADAISEVKVFFDQEILAARLQVRKTKDNINIDKGRKPAGKSTGKSSATPTGSSNGTAVTSNGAKMHGGTPTSTAVGTLDPNRPVKGHAVFSGYKTRKFVDNDVINAAGSKFRNDYPNLCSSFNLRSCSNPACKFKHEVPAPAVMESLSKEFGLELAY